MKTPHEKMKEAYELFMTKRDVPQLAKELVLKDADNIDHLLNVYNENEYEFKKKNDKTESENMYDFLNWVDDIDAGGVSEYHNHTMNDLGLE